MKLPWGKFKGVEIEDVPSGYLRWLAENCEDEPVCAAADEEFRWREQWGKHVWDNPEPNVKQVGLEVDKIAKDMREERVFNKRERQTKGDKMMSENEIVNTTPPQSLELKASMEVAKVAGNPVLLTLIGRSTQLAQWKNFKLIGNQVQYDQAIDAFNEAKSILKDAEDLRHSVVDFPTKVVSLVNALFKSVRGGVEGSKAHIGGIINVKKQADLAAAQRAADATAAVMKKEEVPVLTNLADGTGVIEFEPPPVEVPSNVVESAKGAKVHTRTDTVVEITDLVAFLKAAVSKNKRYEWLSESVGELVVVNLTGLKKLIVDGGKKVVPGVEIKKVMRTV